MEPPRRTQVSYSLKNIPIPSHNDYLMKLIEQSESLIRRMRWRAHFYLKGGDDECEEQDSDEHFGLKSKKGAPFVEELRPFEEDLQKLVGNIEFGKAHNGFQDKLRKDINRIRSSSDAVFVKADKTRNLYQLPKTNYEKLLRENITKYYKKS